MKKQKIMETINNLHQTTNGCWYFKDLQYIYMAPRNGKELNLPYVSSDHESVLQELGIPYRKNRYGNLEYWDPDNSGMKDVTLPIYMRFQNKYRYVGKYTGPVLSEDSVAPANKLCTERVVPALLKKLMGQNPVLGFSGDFSLPTPEEYNFYMDKYTDFKLLPVQKFSKEGAGTVPVRATYAVFNANRIELNSAVTMAVPEQKVRLFIGTGGWQTKSWCKKLGLKFIEVTSR